jgi:DNA-binding NtrC family response regulator
MEAPFPPIALRRFRLVVVEGPDAGKSASSSGARLVVGTDASTSLVLSDGAVSRFHFEIEVVGERAMLRDLGSKNGTGVGGILALSAQLPAATLISVGRSKIRFEMAADLVDVPAAATTSFGSLVGRSAPIRQAFALLERAAASDATVLLLGETGTGKEAAAESIHAASARASGPFVVVDCASVPGPLLEAELFGHERGAFTGAHAARAGALEAASGGTLFLDEIGELGPELQPKLLRALERRETKRLGTTQPIQVDLRFIAATHRDLRAEVNAKRFRADLYYRLAVVEVRLPPLRERLDDLPLLVRHLSTRLDPSGRLGAARFFDDTFLADLAAHAWPGNVRELRNFLERALVLGDAMIAPKTGDDASRVDATLPLRLARERWNDAFERAYLIEILAAHSGNVTAAAEAAGMHRTHFHRLLSKHGVRSSGGP